MNLKSPNPDNYVKRFVANLMLTATFEILHEMKERGIPDDDLVYIDGEHFEPTPVQEASDVLHLDKRRNVRREAALALEFG